MFKEILEIYKEKKCTEIVTTSDIINTLKSNDAKYIKTNFNIETLNDLRSATFYANGVNIVNNKPIILIVEGEYLPNIYTGITEAWFQKANINIIALFKEYDDIKVEYLRRDIPYIVTIYKNEIESYEEKINQFAEIQKPSLINLKYDCEEEIRIKYGKIHDTIEKVLNQDDEVFLYNAENESRNFKITNVEKKYKYGILSKYMGYVTAKEEKTLIILPYDLLNIDLNIFNNRYLNENIKIIVIKKLGQKNNIKEWLNNNKFIVQEKEEINEEIFREFWHENNPSVLVLKEENECIQM